MIDLAQRWSNLWKDTGAVGNRKGIYELIATLYTNSPRYYHNLSHIENCLLVFDETGYLAAHPNEVRMALWLHDAIYDTHAADNEKMSAEFAYWLCVTIGLSHDFSERVARLILATTHDPHPLDIDMNLVTDIDLSSLGSPAEVFDRNGENIRREYLCVPREEFDRKLAERLKKFLDRPRIYYTNFFRQKYEAQARSNLQRTLRNLAKG